MAENVLVVGAGEGISASFARKMAADGAKVVLAARDIDKLADLAGALGAQRIACDARDPGDVKAMFNQLADICPTLDVVLYNPSARVRGPFVELDPDAVKNAIDVTAYGGFLVAQQAVKRMLAQGHGTILFTGASASVKGYPLSASFAMGKFALRGLAQSMARELAPQGIHVAHFVIDGGVRSPDRPGRHEQPGDNPDSFLDPDAIAQSYMNVLRQPRSAWTWEIELRPWLESF